MELVDGKLQQLSQPEVVMGALQNLGAESEAAYMALAAHMSNPTTVKVQINNTVFLYNYAKDVKVPRAICYLYNLDTTEQLPTNIFKFLRKVQRRGIPKIIFISKDGNFLRAFLATLPKLKKYGTNGAIVENQEKKVFLARVDFGTKKLALQGKQ